MIYDFYEVLGRGIVAARTGRSQQAMEYLSLAAKIEPSNPRVWLWLATASETIEGKRQCLQEALQIDPNILAAQVLLDQLSKTDNDLSEKNSKLAIFTCPSCGGKQRFDPDMSGMQCESCGKLEPLMLKNASDREASLSASLQKGSGNWAFVESQSACGACGAVTSHPVSVVTLQCPFCNSDMVTTESATPNLVSPTGIIPFQYHKDDVSEIIATHWGIAIKKLPNLINLNEITLSSIYLPFWTFDATVQIFCQLGRRIPPAVYSPTERVIIKGTEWSAKSWFECDLDDLLIYAARSAPHNLIETILPFDLQALLEYRPEILAGWQAENYQMALEDAAIESHKRMRDLAFKKATRRKLFMLPSEMLQDDVLVLDKTYKLILLPVWIVGRKTSDGSTHIFINGQTGKISERKPSWLDWFKRRD